MFLFSGFPPPLFFISPENVSDGMMQSFLLITNLITITIKNMKSKNSSLWDPAENIPVQFCAFL